MNHIAALPVLHLALSHLLAFAAANFPAAVFHWTIESLLSVAWKRLRRFLRR